jgi:hypothetical protein
LGAFGAYSALDREGPGTLAIALTNFAVLAVLTLFVPAVIAPTEPGSRPDFLFARPVPWWGVWLGRVGACLLVSGLSIGGVALPAYLSHGVRSWWLPWPPVELAASALLAFGGIASVGVASYRARRQVASRALAAAVGAGLGALYLVARVHAYSGWYLQLPPSWLLSCLYGSLAAPVLVFSAVYLAAGRGDPVRAAVAAGIAAVVACAPSVLLPGWVLAFSPRQDAWQPRQSTALPENTTRSGTVVTSVPSTATSKP